MFRKSKYAVAAIAIFTVSSAWGQVYKCPQADGKMAFQDVPCAGGRAVDVRPAAGASSAFSPVAASAVATTSKEKALLDQYEREREIRSVTYDIDHLERAIEDDQRRLDADLDALRAKKRLANNNLAGATWEASISQEMQAVTDRYQTKAAGDRKRLEDLRARRTALSR